VAAVAVFSVPQEVVRKMSGNWNFPHMLMT